MEKNDMGGRNNVSESPPLCPGHIDWSGEIVWGGGEEGVLAVMVLVMSYLLPLWPRITSPGWTWAWQSVRGWGGGGQGVGSTVSGYI